MQHQLRNNTVFWISAFIISLIASVFTFPNLLTIDKSEQCLEAMTKTIHKKDQLVNEAFTDLKETLSTYSEKLWENERISEWAEALSNSGITLFIYRESQIAYWNNNHDFIPRQYNELSANEVLVFYGNTWYIKRIYETGNYQIAALIHIRTEYVYQNQFLKNHYPPDFPASCNDSYILEFEDSKNSIFDINGNYLFSVVFVEDETTKRSFPFVHPIIPYLLFLLLVFSLLADMVLRGRSFRNGFFLLIASYALLRFAGLVFRWPGIIYESELFQAFQFAYSTWYASLGDFLLTSFSIFLLLFFWHQFQGSIPKFKKFPFLQAVISLILLALFFSGILLQLDILIKNSTINFEVNRILETNYFTLIGYWIIALWIVIFILISDILIRYLSKLNRLTAGHLTIMLVLIFATLNALLFVFGETSCLYAQLLGFSILLMIIRIRMRNRKLSYSSKILAIMLASLLTAVVIKLGGEEKKAEIKSIYASNLANERDQVAELFLLNIEEDLPYDEYLANLLMQNRSSNEVIAYLKDEYFSGYWNKYLLQGFWCFPEDSIYVEPENKLVPCQVFFDRLIGENSIKVSSEQFYYLDYNDGSITYLGKISFDSIPGILFLELNSRLITNELGYPELLIEGKQQNELDRYRFSYAKYSRNKLVMESGEFAYPIQGDLFYESDTRWEILSFEEYDHLVYRIDQQNVIIVSSESIKFLDLLILLSYIFVIFHLSYTLLHLFFNLSFQINQFQLNFKTRIQVSMILVVMLTMIFIGGGTVYFSIEQFNNKHYDILHEKIQSVLIELEHKLSRESALDLNQVDYLNTLLIKFSNVFYSDINLYQLDGSLLATSRYEIFEKRLSGSLINPEAYRQLHINNKALFVHKESIGDLSYLSAYIPFRNHNNEVLAYLNLPYFTRQGQIIKEISGLVTAVTNIYLMLILLTLIITVIVSKKITSPLEQLQKKLSSINLQKQNEKIVYSQRDEIGNLINDYNRMVDELERSAEMLAKSERESAWREMARQIAHEIKNPLTPMRLHIQYLQKLMNEGNIDIKEHFDKAADVLLNQIDSLNEIATEFSNFASINKTDKKPVFLIPVIKEVINLFAQTSRAKFTFNYQPELNYEIFANNEQIKRLLINLIKNSLQAIPINKAGEIRIELDLSANLIELKISDNGRGIPENIQEKMFEPYFTTNSSGTGLGLAIVKGIMDDTGGNIHFETNPNTGTCFFLSFPLA